MHVCVRGGAHLGMTIIKIPEVCHMMPGKIMAACMGAVLGLAELNIFRKVIFYNCFASEWAVLLCAQ